MEQILDQLAAFAQEKWYVLLIAAVVLVIIIKIVKTVVKWVLVIAIAAGVLYYGANYTETIKDVGGQILQFALDEAFTVMAGEAENAKYTAGVDGNYKVESANVTIEGNVGSDKVTMTFKGQSFTMKINDTIRNYIDVAKK